MVRKSLAMNLGDAGNIALAKTLRIHDEELEEKAVEALAKESREIDMKIKEGALFTRDEISKLFDNIILGL